MSSSQHTPGPWNVEYPDDDSHIFVTDLQDVTVATVWRQPLDPPEWADSNARLIAAAPEMLSALEVAYAELENHRDVPGIAKHVLPCIRAALAEAKGGAP